MSVTIKFRRGNSTEWTSSGSTILASGEPGYEVDTGRMKIGNGITPWSGLYYSSVVPTGFIAGSGISLNLANNGASLTIDSVGSGLFANEAASLVTTVFNKTGSQIPKMTAVYISGGQGDQPLVGLAIATGDRTSAGTYGLTYEPINHMSAGKVIVFGSLSGVNTDQFNPTAPQGDVNGTVLYLSHTIPGGLTGVKPHAPNHIVALGTIVRTHQNEGVIEVRVQNGFELEELHNVAVTGATNGQFLQYNSTSGLWIPSSSGNFTTLQVNGTGVSISGHTHLSTNITDFNTAVSGNLPTIANSGDNRVLTSTGSSVGINAESNLTFNGSVLSVSGLVSATSGNFINSLQFNGINYLDTTTYIVARPGDNLITKYNEAKALTPRGVAKSATNRASLIIMPGTYVLSNELTIDTQFVDVIGLGSQIKKSAVLLTTNTINVTANDVRVQGISVGDQNFKIADNKPLQIIENCVGNGAFSFGGNDIFIGGTPLTISGTFIGCFSSGMWSFGGANTVSGRFIDCEGGASSFGGSGGIVSGYFERCIGAENSFGQNGLVSGTFLYCIGDNTSFGGSGGPSFGPHTGTPQASGVFKYCSAGLYSFGGGNFAAGIASGIFLYCNASNFSFGGFGSGSLANGTFKYCTGGLKCFCCGSSSIASGYFEYCTGGNGSFAGVDGVSGDTTGTFNYCIAGDNSFGSNINGFYNYCTAGNDSFKQYIGGILNYCKAGTTSFAADLGGAISGVLNNCVGGNNSFNYATPITITGKLHNCIVSSGTFPTPASGGKLINCIDGDGNVITIT